MTHLLPYLHLECLEQFKANDTQHVVANVDKLTCIPALKPHYIDNHDSAYLVMAAQVHVQTHFGNIYISIQKTYSQN